MRYDRARKNLDRHADYILAFYGFRNLIDSPLSYSRLADYDGA